MAGTTKRKRNRTASSSNKIRLSGSSRDSYGRWLPSTTTVLGPMALAARAARIHQIEKTKEKEMTAAERKALEALRNLPMQVDEGDDSDWEMEDINLADILDGNQTLDISHAGGEFDELSKDILFEMRGMTQSPRRVEYRTRRDRIVKRDLAFKEQLPAMVEAYMQWMYSRKKDPPLDRAGPAVGTRKYEVKVVDVFLTRTGSITIVPGDEYIASALVREGLFPCSPITPSVAVTCEVLELYRVCHLRNPHFAIQAFVKALCDLHGVPFERYLSKQFSISFDLYLQILGEVDKRVQTALQHSAPDWRLKHVCPACTYKLAREKSLKYKMLYTMDGNDSLKRILRRSTNEDESDSLAHTESTELLTAYRVEGDFYLARDYVDKWGSETPKRTVNDDISANKAEGNPCAGRWKNMKEDITKKMWGVFDETGLFLSLCRHGFSLVAADMVKSGELSKYPLAVVEKLLDVFGEDLGGGMDINCKFKTTLDNSQLGPRARELRHACLVGAFHGHAHRRLCQLSHLATYTEGLGLEDLEGCERAFSKSNALAGSLRYASVFHRMQAIATYFEHNDTFDVYANLTTFLFNNYRQALSILEDGTVMLKQVMKDLGVTNESSFEEWRKEEREYLMGLQMEPVEETLQMEYWRTLEDLWASEESLIAARNVWAHSTAETLVSAGGYKDATRARETARRHALEKYERTLGRVQDMEMKLGIESRWESGSEDWEKAGRLVAMREYQRALDKLEGLIVARMFELTKMNRSQTGYALRKQIGKALQSRSAAIRTALQHYNTAAQALSPPRPLLLWKEVVEYTFLADFDLLRDARQDISKRPWATPAGRLAMDHWFKLCRAREEIDRLNVEVQRVATYLRDEDNYLVACEERISPQDPALALQITIHREKRGRFNQVHQRRLREIAGLHGFTGSILPGEAVNKGVGESASVRMAGTDIHYVADGDVSLSTLQEVQRELEEEDREEEESDELSEALYHILHISADA